MHLFMERKTIMLISKFNKLIHNKIVWAVFAVLVSLSMVGLFAPTGGPDGSESDGSVGTLFDKPVPRDELMRARLFVQAFQPSRGGEKDQQAVTEEAWGRLAIRRYATQLGLRVSNEELSETIARDPSFAVNGVFNRQRYQQLVEGQMRVPIRLFEDYLREEILLRKIQDLLASSLWISPYELEQSVSRFTDVFTIELVQAAPSNLVADVSVSDEDCQLYYDQNPSQFEFPEQRSVLYVDWSVADIATTVNIPASQIQDAYDRDIEKYSSTDTNTMTVSYTPLEEVADQIRTEIASKEALTIAGEYAMQFLDDLSMLDYGDEVSIHSVAKKFGMNVSTSGLFSATGPVPGIQAGQAFNDAAFQLDPGVPENTYSRAVIGDAGVYVLAWHTNQAAFLQPFADVKEKAEALAGEEARTRAFETRIEEIQDSLKQAIAAKTPFKEAAEALKLTVTALEPFSIYDAGPDKFPHFYELAPAVLTLSSGELSAPVRTRDGVLIVYVAQRVPGDPAEATALKPDINRMLKSGRMRMHFAAWSEHLLAKARGASPADKNQDELR